MMPKPIYFVCNGEAFTNDGGHQASSEIRRGKGLIGDGSTIQLDSSGNRDTEQSSAEIDHCSTQQKCTICQLEPAKVSHFGVPICTGCRAFFRRSVARQKAYRCLGSRLCGQSQPVPNRRVCKFCRFQRCVAAGMLKSKEDLQTKQFGGKGVVKFRGSLDFEEDEGKEGDSRQTWRSSNQAPDAFVIRNWPAAMSEGNGASVLEQFVLCQRKIAFERMSHFYAANGTTGNCGNSDGFTMNDAMRNGWREAALFRRVLFHSLTSNGSPNAQDRDVLLLEYSYCWDLLERLWATIRNGGHQTGRMYWADGNFFQISEEGANRHYGQSLGQLLKDPRPAIHRAIQSFFTASSIAFVNTAREVAKPGLDEEEAAALALLMFTRQDVLGSVSPECAKMLGTIRQRAFCSLAKHVASCGRSVPQRLGEIVALIWPIQEIVLLCKRSATLIRSACTERTLPDEFQRLMSTAEAELCRLQI